ncbi:MAG: LamG domain-containing protein, partial [Bacteroidales bacterium]
LLLGALVSAQSVRVYNQNLRITKVAPALDLQGLGAKIYMDGGASGTITLQTYAAATGTLVLPSSAGTDTLDTKANVRSLVNGKLNISDTAAMLTPYVNHNDTSAMLSNYPIKPEVSAEINDTVVARLAAASVGLVINDYEGGSTGNDYYLTPDQVRSLIVSSGGGLDGKILKFIVGTTAGAPTTADSTLTHANFGGKHLDVYRDGALAYYNGAIAANLNEGFRLNTNTVTVNPLWQDEEEVEVRILDPIAWSDLSLTGEESSLLTGLSAYWKLDETSGSVADDATDTQDASVAGSPSRVVAKLGYGIKFSDAAHVMAVETPVTALDLDTTFSVSFWMKLDSMPSASARTAAYIMNGANLTTPTSSQRIYIPGLDGYIDNPLFRSANTANVSYQVCPNDAGLSDSTWYHIAVIQRGHNDTLYMYVNNVRETLTSGAGGIFSGTVGGTDDALRFGNAGAGSELYFDGILDEIAIWKRELTRAEVGQLYNGGLGKTHPFN